MGWGSAGPVILGTKLSSKREEEGESGGSGLPIAVRGSADGLKALQVE